MILGNKGVVARGGWMAERVGEGSRLFSEGTLRLLKCCHCL